MSTWSEIMNTVEVAGHADENHQLSARVPVAIPPGPVMILIVAAPREDNAGDAWTAAIAREWVDELSDPAQDIYTLSDGAPVHESG